MSSRAVLAAVFLAVALALAGCASFPVGPGDLGGTPTETEDVVVTGVVDGDTVDVRFPDGREDRVRLVGVDTPEVHVAVDPPEFGVPNTTEGRACLRAAGHDASAYTTSRVEGATVTLAYDPLTDRRGGFDRLLAYVVVGDGSGPDGSGTDDGSSEGDGSLNYALVAAGHARVYDTDFTERDRYERAAATARANGTGVWRCVTNDRAVADGGEPPADGDLRLVSVTADPDGHDAANLTGEVVRFENAGDESLALDGWTVTDEAGHRYAFGDVTLAPGDRVHLHTGSGTDEGVDGRVDVYWGADSPIWNNDGDTVIVRDERGAVVLSESY